MNKIKFVKAEIERLKNKLIQEAEKGYKSEFDEGRISAFEDMIVYINSLEEEPVSEDLEEAARKIATRHSHITGDTYYDNDAWFFKKGAQWRKEHLWKDAQSDELPEIDREVIALVRVFPEGHDDLLKVSFAHRPPEYWEGKSILTGKKTRREPMRFGKGGWNLPDVVWWLDVDFPK